MPDFDAVIVGGGQGGARVALGLRLDGFTGSIAIIGEELDPPYDRPPLSKEYLAGAKSFAQIAFQSPLAWEQQRVTLLLGSPVAAVRPAAHQVVVADGSVVGYRHLIWAAGGRPRRLDCPGRELTGVHSIRCRADVDRLLAELPQVTEAVVIGGGYIGLEAAAALTKLGKQVAVVEAADRALARVAGEPLARFYEAEHRAHGVAIHLGCVAERLVGEGDRVTGVAISGGKVLPAQMVIVGIGILPNVEPLLEAGAAGSNGVEVDAFCRTGLADVFAIGDCALHRNRFAEDDWVRLESVQNANDQGTTVAKTICGRDTAYTAVPWFWSNQYDLKLQTVGLMRGHDDLIVRGDPGTRSFSVIYRRQGRVVALDCVNAPRDYSHGRLLVANAVVAGREALAAADRPLKSLLDEKPIDPAPAKV